MMKVPFVDLKSQYLSLQEEIGSAIQNVIDATAFAGGPFVARFEEEFRAFCGTKWAIGVGSGTEALWFALLALGVGPGDEVITVPNTFIATAEAISFCGATPVFVDVDQKTYTMDPHALEEYLIRASRDHKKLKAVIPVHLFGQLTDMDAIKEVAAKYGLPVVEDACQAHGADYKGRRAGSFGAVGCFSFYPGKNLGAYGEAGAITTDDDELAHRIVSLRDHGQQKKYFHNLVGWNGRMDGVQAAILSVKLKHLEEWNNKRRSNAQLYDSLLNGTRHVVTPNEAAYGKHVYHVYAVRVPNRDGVINSLQEKGVSTNIHYPLPIHLQEAYSSLRYKQGDFPVAERCAQEFLSLPMFPELTVDQIEYVAQELKTCVADAGIQV